MITQPKHTGSERARAVLLIAMDAVAACNQAPGA